MGACFKVEGVNWEGLKGIRNKDIPLSNCGQNNNCTNMIVQGIACDNHLNMFSMWWKDNP